MLYLYRMFSFRVMAMFVKHIRDKAYTSITDNDQQGYAQKL